LAVAAAAAAAVVVVVVVQLLTTYPPTSNTFRRFTVSLTLRLWYQYQASVELKTNYLALGLCVRTIRFTVVIFPT
jgi:hypothetical protein